MANEKKKQNRQKRLSQQLRANLLRRKTQVRGRREEEMQMDCKAESGRNKATPDE